MKATAVSSVGRGRCTARNRRGLRCGAPPLTGTQRCFWHAKETEAAATEARRQGGRTRALALRPAALVTETSPETVEPPTWWPLDTQDQVLEGVKDLARATLGGRLDTKRSNAGMLALGALLGEGRQRQAQEQARDLARRTWGKAQLLDRIDQLQVEFADLVERIQRVPANDWLALAKRALASGHDGAPDNWLSAELDQIRKLVDYVRVLAGKVVPTPDATGEGEDSVREAIRTPGGNETHEDGAGAARQEGVATLIPPPSSAATVEMESQLEALPGPPTRDAPGLAAGSGGGVGHAAGSPRRAVLSKEHGRQTRAGR